jgi:hypothetical protein
MNFLRLIPVILSLLLLGAHFFRASEMIFVYTAVVLIFLLLIRKTWVPWLIQFALFLGAVEWIYTLILFAQFRASQGMPWTRMAVILGGVALFTALSGLVFRSKGLRKRYAGKTSTE